MMRQTIVYLKKFSVNNIIKSAINNNKLIKLTAKDTREEIKHQYANINTLETTISQLKTELKLEKSNSVVKIDVANAIFSTENDALREEIQRLKLIVLNSNEAHNAVLE